jgi:hypothetical protein
MFFLINWLEPKFSPKSIFVLVTIKSKFDLVTFIKLLSPLGCSSCSCSPFVSIHRGFEFSLGEVSDGPRVPGGRSAGAWRTVRVLLADGPLVGVVSGGSVCFFRRSAAQGRTVRGVCADCPRQQAGRSAWPVRTVRPTWPDSPPEPECFVPWFVSSLPSFVLPRVLQGMVPKTRG